MKFTRKSKSTVAVWRILPVVISVKFAKLILFSILVLAGGIRFWQIVELGYFMIDEERDAFLVRRMLVDHRPLLVGGVIPGGISIGPLFFYLSAIPYAISQLNPLGPAYAAGIIGVITVIETYVVGRALFGRRVGLLAMAFSAFSLLNIVYHRPWWPLTFGQSVTLVVYLALFRLIQKRSDLGVRQGPTLQGAWLWMFVVALIVGTQSDPSTFSLIPLSIIFLWMNRKRVDLSRKTILLGAVLFLISHISILIFELRHDFQNTRAIIQFFSKIDSSGFSFSISNLKSVSMMTSSLIYRLFIPTGPLDVTKQINPCIEFLSMRRDGVWRPGAWGLLVLVGIYVISALLKGRTLAYAKVRPFQIARQLLSLHLLIAFFGILAFTSLQRGYVHEWLWSFMFPTFFLVFADLLFSLSEKVRPYKIRPFFVAIVGGWIVWQVHLGTFLENTAGLGGKLRVVQAANREIGDRPYELSSDGDPESGSDCFRYGGWRYLFTLNGNQPVKSYMDYVYERWVYPPSGKVPDTVVTIINPLDDPPRYTKTPAGP